MFLPGIGLLHGYEAYYKQMGPNRSDFYVLRVYELIRMYLI